LSPLLDKERGKALKEGLTPLLNTLYNGMLFGKDNKSGISLLP